MKRSIFYTAVLMGALCPLAFGQNPFVITSPLPPVGQPPLPNLLAADVCIPSPTVTCTTYSFTFTTNAGQQGVTGALPITWIISAGFPSELTLSRTSSECPGTLLLACTTLSGSPSTSGRYLSSVVANSSTPQALGTFVTVVMDVNAQPTFNSFFPTALPTGVQQQAYTIDLSTVPVVEGSGSTVTGGTPPFRWSTPQAGSNSFPIGFVPFTSIVSVTAPIANGDRLILGNAAPGAFAAFSNLQQPTLSAEVFRDVSIQLAPGQSFSNLYVPTAADRTGNYSDFAGLLIDPSTGAPFPGGIIPTSRLDSLFAFRIAPSRLPTGLTLSAAGVLSGTPSVAGSFSLPIRATDSAGCPQPQPACDGTSGATTITATLPLSIIPALAITSSATLPQAEFNIPYSFTFTAGGGTPAYSWSLGSGSSPPAGLNFSNVNLANGTVGGQLAGRPNSTGTFPFSVFVNDQSGQIVQQSTSLIVNPPPRITTTSPLPDGEAGSSYSMPLSATGGIPPFSKWTIAAGSAAGLNLDPATGLLSGKLNTAGSFSFTVQVTDSIGGTASAQFTLNITLPTVPTITINVPATGPNDQPHAQISLSSSYSLPITGQAMLTFNPDGSSEDGMVRFMNAPSCPMQAGSLNGLVCRTLDFTIPANSTTADATFMSGTTAGTVTVSVTTLQSAGIALKIPTSGTVVIPAAAPVLMAPAAASLAAVTATRSTGALTVTVSGFCTARQITGAIFQFGGNNLGTGSSQTLNVTSMFSGWYQDPTSIPTGTAFTYVQPFSIQGNPNNVTSVTVTLIGPPGESQPMTAQIQQQ